MSRVTIRHDNAILLITACCGLIGSMPTRADEPAAPPKPKFWVIPHTHWEGAVFKTREEYLQMGLPNILHAMRLLREQPGYHFTLDQVAYIRPFLERYPAEEADFRRFIQEGRLQLAGALDVMPDDNMPGGETFVRQMQYGKCYYRQKLGVDVTSGWLIDTFGHHAQMPQLLVKGGFQTFWFVRGVPRQDFPSEFFWEGIDGTRIASFYLPHSYALTYGSPHDTAAFRNWAIKRFELLTPNAHGPDRVGLAGPDVADPEDHLIARIDEFNRDPQAPFTMRMAVPADFEKAVAGRTDLPVWKGELNPIFQGIYSSRIELKVWMRVMEERLLTAEKLSVLAAWLGSPFDLDGIWAGWEPVLFNQTHDLASGVMTDHVYEDTIRSYEFARRRAEAIIDAKWDVLTTRIDTRGPGTPVVVFNTLGWTRSDIAFVDAGFGVGGVRGIVVTDSEGKAVPAQILESTRYADGGLKTARVAFVACDVPALGFATYHVAPERSADGTTHTPASAASVRSADSQVALENEHYRMALDRATGAIISLRLKSNDWEVFAACGNVVTRQQDRGDLWELYKGLDGGSRVAMTTRQNVPRRGQAAFSDEGKGEPGTVLTGPVFSELRVARLFGSGRFATTVRIYAGLRRIEITTRLVNQEKYVRYQALFPTTIAADKSVHEIPFGAIDRPGSIEFPAQNWVDHGDGQRGLAVLNIGLPGNLVTEGTMMVSLMRAHTLGAYGFGGGYEPGMSSESGLQLGTERVMRYALLPHAGDWRDAGIVRAGWELNHPLMCRNESPHSGALPKRWGLLDVSNPNVVVSSLKPSTGGDVALRIYEASGRPAPAVVIKLRARVQSAHEANLMEDPGTPLSTEGDVVRLDLGPFEIKTVKLRLGD
jgi:alpha-mannosidase